MRAGQPHLLLHQISSHTKPYCLRYISETIPGHYWSQVCRILQAFAIKQYSHMLLDRREIARLVSAV